MYEVGGEVVADRLKWACIDEVDHDTKTLWVTDEDGETFELMFDDVISYTKG